MSISNSLLPQFRVGYLVQCGDEIHVDLQVCGECVVSVSGVCGECEWSVWGVCGMGACSIRDVSIPLLPLNIGGRAYLVNFPPTPI